MNQDPELKFKYLKKVSTLVVGLIFYGIVAWIMLNLTPDQFQNFLWPNSYLLLMVVFWLANFFVGAFVSLSSRKGLEWAVISSLWLYLRLLQVSNWWMVVLGVGVMFGVVEGLLAFLKGRGE
jgi:hypothetical protein